MLGAAWVEYIHDELLHKFWPGGEYIGARGVKDRGLLESAVGRLYQSVFGQDAYPDVTDKAVALFHSLVSNHPFHDGNKRTAVTALHHFLRRPPTECLRDSFPLEDSSAPCCINFFPPRRPGFRGMHSSQISWCSFSNASLHVT